MTENIKVRWGLLKFMYIYTIIGAGVFGTGMCFFPETIKSMFIWPVKEPIALAIVGSTFLTFGIISIFGLYSPLKFVSILLMQLVFMIFWFVGVFPFLLVGKFPNYAIIIAVIFLTYVIGDLIAIPFSYIFKTETMISTKK